MAFVTLAYYVKVQREMLFGPVLGRAEQAREVSAAMYVPLIILAIVCAGFGLLYPVWGSAILEPARDALLNGAEYIKLVLG
jgi:formate hydrogenlyase subunit 3/multisubunit Na+/H+ antiporter MnhD subunit